MAAASASLLGMKTSCFSAAAEVGPVDALAGIGEQDLVDHVADVIVLAGLGGSAAAVDVEREVQEERHG